MTVLTLLIISNVFTFIFSSRAGSACSQANIDPQTAFGRPLPVMDITAFITEPIHL